MEVIYGNNTNNTAGVITHHAVRSEFGANSSYITGWVYSIKRAYKVSKGKLRRIFK
jgi:hypothetical protein